MTSLAIYESFFSWQGEGYHMGKAAFFIRTFGCPLQCPWCDSAGTWHPDWVPDSVERMPVGELAARAKMTKAEFVVVTGGEPTIHDLRPLTKAIALIGLPTHLETAGSFEIRGDFQWVTVSPKWAKPPLPENLQSANEIKLIIENEHSIDCWLPKIEPYLSGQPVWLHPEWSQRANPRVLSAISIAVKQRGSPFRAGYQLHRIFNVDALDTGARPTVPIGGHQRLGF
jgi:organic radical activating enzyme